MDEDKYMSSEERVMLRKSLEDLLPVVEVLKRDALRDAAVACLTLLKSPERIEKGKIAPIILAISERAGEAMREFAEEAGGDLGAQLKDSAGKADEDVEWLSRVVESYRKPSD